MDGQKSFKTLIIATTTSFLFFIFGNKPAISVDEPIWALNSISSSRIQVLLTAPFGLYAGEYDARSIFPIPYNGLYSSYDLGKTWSESGLNKKGITGLAYKGSDLYAGTYFSGSTPAGIYKSQDKGKTWVHTGSNLSALALASTSNAILFGTASNGLYRTADNGTTWQQVIGNGFAPGIKTIAAHKSKALAASNDNKVYFSSDDGASWQEITFLRNKVISYMFINDKIILTGTSNNTGMFKSQDLGKTWVAVNSWGSKSSGAFAEIKGVIYAGGYSEKYLAYGVFKSADWGITWFDISSGLLDKNGNILSIAAIYSIPDKLFITQTARGVYEYQIPKPDSAVPPFLDLPWAYFDFKNDALRIYSFFDHEYPLLGSGISEPIEAKTTTINFSGIEKPEPYMWYSSHNGIDFTLPFGTEILAPADGYASYSYGNATGNMIKIDHGNGFETWYMHLQNKELAVSTSNKKVFVKKLGKIGLVGLTGNTTGPHLHFSVLRDKNGNNLFDDLPDGIVDPYGWEGDYLDPWESFSWSDGIGVTHTGSKSYYLFTRDLASNGVIIGGSIARLVLNLFKELEFPESIINKIGTVEAKDYPLGRGGPSNLKELETSGFTLKAYDLTGEKIEAFDTDYTISIDYGNLDISNLNEDLLKIYRWDDATGNWSELASAVNKTTKKITAQTNLPGEFAVFSPVSDITPPVTTAEVQGSESGGAFTTSVYVVLTAKDEINGAGIDSTFFSLDNGENWDKYEDPIYLKENGSYKIYYKSIDKAGNMEEAKTTEFTIQKSGWSKTIAIISTQFETGTW